MKGEWIIWESLPIQCNTELIKQSYSKKKIIKTAYLFAVGVVSLLAFYSDDMSLIPAEVCSFACKNCLKRTKIDKKEVGLAQFKEFSSKSNCLQLDT